MSGTFLIREQRMCRNPALGAVSVYDHAWQEAFRHKWIESEKHGRDLGHGAISDWSCRHFNRFYRWCHWLHLTGCQCFREFGCEQFGSLTGPLGEVEREIVGLFWDGKENLEIYCRAHGHGWPLDRVYHVLMTLDINGSRLSPLIA